MTDTTAKIRAKGLDATGVTEEIANQMYTRKGAHYMAIVEFKVEERHEKADGTKKVDLVLTQVEPAIDETLEDHLRELTRTLHFNRAIDADQPTLDGGDGINPKVGDVIKAGHQHRPHPFLPVDASDDNGICDVCGLINVAGVHSTQGFLPDGDEDEEENEGDPDAEPDAHDGPGEPIGGEPWEYAAPEGQDEPVEYDERPNDIVLAKEKHVHVAGECIKNRHGAICTPMATIPDPFTAGA